jgi:hypothetical protein
MEKGNIKGVFMKNFVKTFGIIAFAVIIGFSMASCKDGNSNDNDNVSGGILTFTDQFPVQSFSSFIIDLYIIANNVDTSGSNWKSSASIVAHVNSHFSGYKVDYADKTITLSVPARQLTVANHTDVSSSDKAWTGSGTYTIYVAIGMTPTEYILKDVTFKDGCATVSWGAFTRL